MCLLSSPEVNFKLRTGKETKKNTYTYKKFSFCKIK
jgi:hypothetical protein